METVDAILRAWNDFSGFVQVVRPPYGTGSLEMLVLQVQETHFASSERMRLTVLALAPKRTKTVEVLVLVL